MPSLLEGNEQLRVQFDALRSEKPREQWGVEERRLVRDVEQKLHLEELLRTDRRTGYQKMCENGSIDLISQIFALFFTRNSSHEDKDWKKVPIPEIQAFVSSCLEHGIPTRQWVPNVLNRALYRATMANDQKFMQLAIAMGAQIDVPIEKGRTILHIVAEGLHVTTMQWLLGDSSHAYIPPYHPRPLMVNVPDVAMETPLHKVFSTSLMTEGDKGTKECISLLMRHGAVGSLEIQNEAEGNTPLHDVTICGSEDELDILLGAPLQTQDSEHAKKVLNLKNLLGETPLFLAILEERSPLFIQKMIQAGCSVLERDLEDDTVLHKLAMVADQNEQREEYDFDLKPEKVEQLLKENSQKVETSALEAQLLQEVNQLPDDHPARVAQILLESAEASTLIMQKNVDGMTPLHIAADQGSVHVLNLILQAVKKHNVLEIIDTQNKMGHSALHFAAMSGRKIAAELLLGNGANNGILDSDQNTPFYVAVREGYMATALVLKGNGLKQLPEYDDDDDEYGDDENE